MSRTRTLEQRYIISLAESFLRSDFSLLSATQFFGELRHSTRWRHHFSPPPTSNIEEALVEHTDGAISGVRVWLKKPIEADLSEMIQLLGPCDELQRLSPFDEVPYRFMVRGESFDGTILLFASRVELPKISASRVALYRGYPPQIEAPVLTEEQLSQMVELFVTQRFSMEQAANLFACETAAQTLSPSELNLQRVELELSPANEVEGIWGQLITPAALTMEKLTERFGAGKWSASEGFGPTYDIEQIRRGAWLGRLSLQCAKASNEVALVESFLLRKYAEESVGFPFWDSQESILTLVDLFLDRAPSEEFLPEFFLGEIYEETPLHVRLTPMPSSNLQEATLEKTLSADGKIFLSGVSLRLKAPIEVDWIWLESSLGISQKLPHWKLPNQQFYRLLCLGSKGKGSLWLGVNASMDGYWVESVTLRREGL